MRKVGVIVAALLAASAASAEPLYQEFEQGASEQAVLERFGGAKLDENNSDNRIHAYRLEDHPAPSMWTYFRFLDGGLAEVKFYGRGAAQYLQIVEGLRSRYGEPTSENHAADSGVAIWRRGASTITAQLDHSYSTIVGRVNEPFSITYAPETASLESAL